MSYTFRMTTNWYRHAALLVCAAAFCATASAQPAEITINDTMMSPESITSSADGAVIFGSTTKGNIYRAARGATSADVWISAPAAGLQRVLGVLADDAHQTLWVCTTAPAAPGGAAASAPVGAAPAGDTGVKAFAMPAGTPKGSYRFPGNRGLCNDIAVAPDGTLYATDTQGGRVLRLAPGAAEMTEWSVSPLLASADGLVVLADGSICVNTFSSGTLVKIPLAGGGAAGEPVKLETSRPIVRPDGMRTVRGNTLLLVEGDGHLDEVRVEGNRAEITTLKDGFMGATAVTLVGSTAYVLEGRTKATAVPYTPR
jgi:hypothetical protein